MSVRSNTAAQLAQDMQNVKTYAQKAQEVYDNSMISMAKTKWDQLYSEFEREVKYSNDFSSYDTIAQKYQARMMDFLVENKVKGRALNYMTNTYLPSVKNTMRNYSESLKVEGQFSMANVAWDTYIAMIGKDETLTYDEKRAKLSEYYNSNGIGDIPVNVIPNVTRIDDAMDAMQVDCVNQAIGRYYATHDATSYGFSMEEAVQTAIAESGNPPDGALRLSLSDAAWAEVENQERLLQKKADEQISKIKLDFNNMLFSGDSQYEGMDIDSNTLYQMALQAEGSTYVDSEGNVRITRQWSGFFEDYQTYVLSLNQAANASSRSPEEVDKAISVDGLDNAVPVEPEKAEGTGRKRGGQPYNADADTVPEYDTPKVDPKITDKKVASVLENYADDNRDFTVEMTSADGQTLEHTFSQEEINSLISGKTESLTVTVDVKGIGRIKREGEDTGPQQITYSYTRDDFIEDYVDGVQVPDNASEGDDLSNITVIDNTNYNQYQQTATVSSPDKSESISTDYWPVVVKACNELGISLDNYEGVKGIVQAVNAKASTGYYDNPVMARVIDRLTVMARDPNTSAEDYSNAVNAYITKATDPVGFIKTIKDLGLWEQAMSYKSLPADTRASMEAKVADALFKRMYTTTRGKQITDIGVTAKVKTTDGTTLKTSEAKNSDYYNATLGYAYELMQISYQTDPELWSLGADNAKVLNDTISSILDVAANVVLEQTIGQIDDLYRISIWEAVFSKKDNASLSQLTDKETGDVNVQAFAQRFYRSDDVVVKLCPPSAQAKAYEALEGLERGKNYDYASTEARDAVSQALYSAAYDALNMSQKQTVDLGIFKYAYEADCRDTLAKAFAQDGVDTNNLIRFEIANVGPAYMDVTTGKFYSSDSDTGTVNKFWTGQFSDAQRSTILMSFRNGYMTTLPESELAPIIQYAGVRDPENENKKVKAEQVAEEDTPRPEGYFKSVSDEIAAYADEEYKTSSGMNRAW